MEAGTGLHVDIQEKSWCLSRLMNNSKLLKDSKQGSIRIACRDLKINPALVVVYNSISKFFLTNTRFGSGGLALWISTTGHLRLGYLYRFDPSPIEAICVNPRIRKDVGLRAEPFGFLPFWRFWGACVWDSFFSVFFLGVFLEDGKG